MVRYTGYITTNNNNKKGNDMNTFQQYETRIGKGESEALAAWWDAGADMVAAIAKGTYKDVAAFATAWAKVSKSWKYNTINVNMGVIKWAIEMGYKCDEFKSLQHVKRTRSESAVKRQPKAKASPTLLDDILPAALRLNRKAKLALIAKLQESL